MEEILFLVPEFKERIWGGRKLESYFSYAIPYDRTGECWGISAHPNGDCQVKNGYYKGKTLSWLWEHEKFLFGDRLEEKFPLLIKILDAHSDLSVQVHPSDEYAKEHENGEYGKTECWYVIDCDQDAELVFGHTATSLEQIKEQIDSGQWNELLQRVKVKPGDFFYVPSGTVHALCSGTLILETQQNSDTTYRMYDYNRKDEGGNLRELHLEKAIAVTSIPHSTPFFEKKVSTIGNNELTTFIESDFFSVYRWNIKETLTSKMNMDFLLCTVLKGQGEIFTDHKLYSLTQGDHFIIPNTVTSYTLNGNLELMVSQP